MNRHERREAARKSRQSSARQNSARTSLPGSIPAAAATSPAPGATPDELCAAGLGHVHAGRRLDAQVCCQQALALDAGHADSLHLMGLLAFNSQDYDHALEWIAR